MVNIFIQITFFYSVSVQAYFRFYNFCTFYKPVKVLYFNHIHILFVSTKCRKTVCKVWFCRRIAEKQRFVEICRRLQKLFLYHKTLIHNIVEVVESVEAFFVPK